MADDPNNPATAPAPAPAPSTAEAQSRKAEALREKYLAAVKAMDSPLRDRVVAVHPYAESSEESIAAMQADYDRLKAEQDKAEEAAKAGSTAQKPMGTAG